MSKTISNHKEVLHTAGIIEEWFSPINVKACIWWIVHKGNRRGRKVKAETSKFCTVITAHNTLHTSFLILKMELLSVSYLVLMAQPIIKWVLQEKVMHSVDRTTSSQEEKSQLKALLQLEKPSGHIDSVPEVKYSKGGNKRKFQAVYQRNFRQAKDKHDSKHHQVCGCKENRRICPCT